MSAYKEGYSAAAKDGIKAVEAMQRKLDAMTADRDEWKQQHENLLAVRQQDIAALNARQAEAAPVASAEPEYFALRLKRVARAAGVPIYAEWSNEQILDCAVTILGEIARKLEVAQAAPAPADEQLRRMRAAFHTNMLRAFPDKSHEEIAAEIDRAVGCAAPAPEAAAPVALTREELAQKMAGKMVNDYGYRMLLKGEEIGFCLTDLLEIVKLAAPVASHPGKDQK